MGWGGSRSGAGRKAEIPRKYVTIRIDIAVADYIKNRAKEESIPLGAIVERCVRVEMEGRQ